MYNLGGGKKKSIFVKTADAFELPGDLAAGIFRVTITGGRKVNIENHRGIIEYTEERIKVNCGNTVVSVCGNRLEIKAISAKEMLIGGKIFDVKLEG